VAARNRPPGRHASGSRAGDNLADLSWSNFSRFKRGTARLFFSRADCLFWLHNRHRYPAALAISQASPTAVGRRQNRGRLGGHAFSVMFILLDLLFVDNL
jgi:hypothetical protein